MSVRRLASGVSGGGLAGRKEKENKMKLNKLVTGLKNGLRKAVDYVDRRANQAVAVVAAAGTLVLGAIAHAQTDATVIATNAQTAFGVIAPITITIAGFYVILKIAKKVVH
jgi:hypothetical protein